MTTELHAILADLQHQVAATLEGPHGAAYFLAFAVGLLFVGWAAVSR